MPWKVPPCGDYEDGGADLYRVGAVAGADLVDHEGVQHLAGLLPVARPILTTSTKV